MSDLLFGALELLGCIDNESLSCGGTHLLCKDVQQAVAFAGTAAIFISCHRLSAFVFESDPSCGDSLSWNCEE